MKIFRNNLIKSTVILVATSMIIKFLALAYRIILTRILENEGISLYILSIPTIMLFISLGGFTLNLTLSKMISENEITNKYSNKTIIKKTIMIALIVSLITILILVIIAKPLSYQWLKQPNTYYPICATIFIIPISSINNVIKGYYNGINKVNIGAYSGLIEQICRIIISIAFLFIFVPYGIVISVTASVIAMGFGELLSLVYGVILLKKYPISDNHSKLNPTKEIFCSSLPLIGTRMMGNMTYFLEPIVYTFALGLLSYNSNEIAYFYSEINAYSIPLITMFSFLSLAIATVIIPNLSKFHSLNNQEMVRYYIKKSIIVSLVPGIFISILLTFYGKEYMNLLYNVDIGSDFVQRFSLLFLLFYIQAPLVAILQAIDKSKINFNISLIFNLLKLGLIIVLSFIPWINKNSLIIAMLISMIGSTLYYYFYIKNSTKFHFSGVNFINIFIISIVTFLVLYIMDNLLNINYLISTGISLLIFLSCCYILKLTRVDDK